jgi:hypothetical protein
MYKVTFRKTDELLTAMFCRSFESESEAKAFIENDAGYYAESHGFAGSSELVNEDPDFQDYFVLYRRDGEARTPELVYQYFRV